MTKFEDELRDDMEYGRNNITPGSRYYSLLEAANLLLEILPEIRALVWQPIESAPRDGTEILVYASNRPLGKECTVAFWKDEKWAFLDHPHITLYLDDDITHWMLIPTTTLTEKLKKAGAI